MGSSPNEAYEICKSNTKAMLEVIKRYFEIDYGYFDTRIDQSLSAIC